MYLVFGIDDHLFLVVLLIWSLKSRHFFCKHRRSGRLPPMLPYFEFSDSLLSLFHTSNGVSYLIVYFMPGFVKNEFHKLGSSNSSKDTTESSSTGYHVSSIHLLPFFDYLFPG